MGTHNSSRRITCLPFYSFSVKTGGLMRHINRLRRLWIKIVGVSVLFVSCKDGHKMHYAS